MEQRCPAPRPARDAQCLAAFRQHFDFVHRALRRYGAGPADLDDLVQEVFVTLWLRWEEFDERRPLRPWLAGIAFRMARNNHRRRRREVPGGVVLEAADQLAQGEESLASARARALVLRVLERLPDKYRLPLVMHDLDELTAPEVARALELPLATVYTRLRRARLAFARLVGELQGPETSLEAGALLALEREPPAVGEPTRRRALARLRAVLAAPLVPRARPAPPAGAPLVSWLAVASAIPLAAYVLAAPGTVSGRSGMARGHGSVPAAAATATAAAIDHHPPAPWPAERSAAPAPLPAGPVSLKRGLFALWSFDGDPETGRVADASGQARDCSLRGGPASFVSGVRGRALELARGGWLECPLPPTPAGAAVEMTVALWVQRASLSKPAALVTRQLGSGFQDQFFFGFAGDGLRVVSHAWSGWAVDPDPPAPGRWFHAAFTHDRAGTTRLYVDGREVARSQGRLLDPRAVSAPATIGAGRFAPQESLVRQRFQGGLDEITVYDRALEPAEIAALAAP